MNACPSACSLGSPPGDCRTCVATEIRLGTTTTLIIYFQNISQETKEDMRTGKGRGVEGQGSRVEGQGSRDGKGSFLGLWMREKMGIDKEFIEA